MNELERPSVLTPVRIAIAVSLLMLLVMLGVVVFRLATRPLDVTLTVSAPAGERVFCDFVIDGRPEEHVDTIPVTYTYHAHQLAYAIIPVSPSAGQITVERSIRFGAGSWTSDGVTGTFEGNGWESTSSINGMTPTHIKTMRAAALARKPLAHHKPVSKSPPVPPEAAPSLPE